MDAGRQSILVVEDEALIALPIQRSLQKLGYTVEIACSAPEALQLAASAAPDLVLMDVMLGGENDGIVTAGEIRRLHGIPVVYLTAYADDATVGRAKQTEPFGYLVKPFREKELHTTVAIAIHNHRVELERQERELWFSSVLSSVGDGVLACDLDGAVTYLNPVAAALTCCDAAQAVGRRLFSVVQVLHESGAAGIATTLLKAIRNGSPSELPEGCRLASSGNDAICVSGKVTPLLNTRGELRGAVLVLRDITSEVRAQEQLRHNFLHDPLTGLPNRTLLLERLHHRWHLRQRDPEDLFAILFLDLDRFKLINDSLGHLVGDRYLVEIADRLRGVVRPYDTLARLGGDEFTVLLENLTDLRQPWMVAERIQALLAAPILVDEHEIVCAASIGIAVCSASHHNPEDLLRDADIAMYRAKSSPTSRIAIFDADMRASVLAVVQLEKDLRQAMANGEFTVFYQPIVGLMDGRLRSVEALVRWHHPRRGLLEPDAFLQVAEETGMIRRINPFQHSGIRSLEFT